MPKPASLQREAVFDLEPISAEMRLEPGYARTGHTARTLVRKPDLRIVLVVARAGSHIAEHQASDTASIHVIDGRLRLTVRDAEVDLARGGLLALDSGMRHDVVALEDSAFVLTLG